MSKSISECIIEFVDGLAMQGNEVRDMTIELPYVLRLKLQLEMNRYDTSIGRVPEFTLNTSTCAVLITSLKSEREEALRVKLGYLKIQRDRLDQEEKELNKILGTL